MELLITLCPHCSGYHKERVEVPPVMENYITEVKQAGGSAVSLPCRFICPEEGASYEIEAAFYRPYTRIRALDCRAWPGVEEEVARLGPGDLAVIELQSGGALGGARWECDTA